ncbi:MAG: tRNA dimethylallyltransferase, partial [Gaiellaceae bacterium]
GPERAHALLAERDPYAAEVVHTNDRRRVVRALELHALGRSLRNSADRLWSDETRHPTVIVGLDAPRETVTARIETRAAEMWELGAEEEALSALAGPLSAQARAAIGLREVAENRPVKEAITSVAARTRRYAAYQRKWMRRIPGIVMIDADRTAEEVADAILKVGRAGERVSARRAHAADG